MGNFKQSLNSNRKVNVFGESFGKGNVGIQAGDYDENSGTGTGGEKEGTDVDPDALAFIKAKRKVDDMHKAKKLEKKGN
jgi:hypothetical protein